jgi:hypothetical protein
VYLVLFLLLCHLWARIVCPEEMSFARRWLCEHVCTAVDLYAALEELLEALFLCFLYESGVGSHSQWFSMFTDVQESLRSYQAMTCEATVG